MFFNYSQGRLGSAVIIWLPLKGTQPPIQTHDHSRSLSVTKHKMQQLLSQTKGSAATVISYPCWTTHWWSGCSERGVTVKKFPSFQTKLVLSRIYGRIGTFAVRSSPRTARLPALLTDGGSVPTKTINYPLGVLHPQSSAENKLIWASKISFCAGCQTYWLGSRLGGRCSWFLNMEFIHYVKSGTTLSSKTMDLKAALETS